MYIAKKIVIREDGQHTLRIKSINWQGTRYALELDGEQIATGSEEVINNKYNEM